MKLFGLTGGIGMGKSTAGQLLQKRGVPVIDTDMLARELAEPGQPALERIQERFGPRIIGPDGRLRRDELARLVFADPKARRDLEAILHPPIRDAWQAETRRWRQQGVNAGVVVIPLLFETDAASLFDATVCLVCSSGSQQQRLRERGWSEVEIKQRIESQWPIEKKILLSKFVIWTDTTVEAHAAQLERVIR